VNDMVIVTYHRDFEALWAEVDVLPTFSAAADTFEELRELVFAALADLLPAGSDIREDVNELNMQTPQVVYLTSAPSMRESTYEPVMSYSALVAPA